VQGLRPAGLVFGLPKTRMKTIQVADNRFAFGPEAELLALAMRKGDDNTVGELLGYPSCCRAFFARTWGAGALDTTQQMAGDGTGPIQCNILGRWLGVRFVMHLPCSWTCDATVRNAARWLDLWPMVAHAWATEILSWPAQWSALHGIAEVSFPVCKLSTRTTPGIKGIVRRPGIAPAEGATGSQFPFTAPPRLMQFHDQTAANNGFSSRQAMTASHDMVIAELSTSPPRGLTVDLGCGTGHLMRRIGKQFNVPVLGIECDASRVGKAEDIRIMNLSDLEHLPVNVDTFVVSQNRFDEIPALEEWVYAHARQVLISSYDPPLFAVVRQTAQEKVLNGRS
jgi:hypothetical protein